MIGQVNWVIKSFLSLLFLLGSSTVLFGQTNRLVGKVCNAKQQGLTGATVFWLGTTIATTTHENGEFDIAYPDNNSAKLVVRLLGFNADTLSGPFLKPLLILLFENRTLTAINVEGRKEGISISDINPIKTEQISQIELGKAACCDLAGCFETQSTVQPQVTNVVTNAKELRILGLSGVYNQILIDGFPMIQGLTYTYGISNIPGSLVENIFIAKGANSVLQGFESISGQINVETKSPDKTDRLYLNAYVNNFQEKHLNLNYAVKKEKWSNLSAIHMVQPAARFDRDDDGFLDLPLLSRYLFSNRWKYGKEKNWGLNSQIGFRIVHEERTGGQTNFNSNQDKGSPKVYGQWVQLLQPEIWTKTSYKFNDEHQLTAYVSSFAQWQDAWFGELKYQGRQANFYSNIQHEWNYGQHNLKSGVSLRLFRIEEDIIINGLNLFRNYSGKYARQELIPGAFTENTFRWWNNRFNWITGIRIDHHNQFGAFITPRTLLKFDVSPNTIVRINAGNGWRTVNLFSENIGLLASARNVEIVEQLEPEQAFNAGINLTQKFKFMKGKLSGYLSADYYRTEFSNQIFPDYDSSPTSAIIRNFRGTSRSETFQLDGVLRWDDLWEYKLGCTWLEVYRVEGENRVSLPFNPNFKMMSALSYQPRSKRFQIDFNFHWYGQQRLPDTRSNPEALRRPDYSPSFSLLNSQFTYRFKKWEVYAGCENVLDFRQLRPILGWQEPFGRNFDPSFVWGPTRGREVYMGFRLKVL